MKRLAIILAFALLLVGCRGSKPTPGGESNPPATGGGGGVTYVTDPGQIYDPTQSSASDRAEVAKMDIPALIAALDDERLGDDVTNELTARGSDAVDPLIDALGSDNVVVRQRAIFTLGRLGEPAKVALPKLQEIASSESEAETIVASAAHAIDHIQGK